MKPSKGTNQSYELNYLSNEAKEGGLRLPTCHYTSPNAIVVGVASRTQSIWATFTLHTKPVPRKRSRGAFEHLGPKLQVGLHENLVLVALSWSQIFCTTLLTYGHHVGQVEVWAKPLYKVLWPNLQHLSSAIGHCRGFFGTGLVYKAPLVTPR
jgi:hypothetical protein